MMQSRVLGKQRRAVHQCCTSTSAASSRAFPRDLVRPYRRCCRSSNNGVVLMSTAADVKQDLALELKTAERGIFGVPAAKKAAILALIEQLESQNPTSNPTQHLELAAGSWRLLYSTIVITGAKKTKLGLREFVTLGDFIQTINLEDQTAVNTVEFSVTGLSKIRGALTIRASFRVESDSRVAITYTDSSLVPVQLQTIFQKNLYLLLSIFNPEGHLDITYLDNTLRVGRDDKGNVFLVERCSSPVAATQPAA